MKQLFVTQREPAFSRDIYLDERWARAFARAAEKRRQAKFIDHRHFQVLSSKSTYKKRVVYDIVYTGNGLTGWECSCPSGYASTACWHRGQVLKRLEREPHLTNPPPRPIAPRPRTFIEVRPEIARSRKLCEQAKVIQAQSARLKAEMQERREGVAVGATRLEDLYE